MATLTFQNCKSFNVSDKTILLFIIDIISISKAFALFYKALFIRLSYSKTLHNSNWQKNPVILTASLAINNNYPKSKYLLKVHKQ